VNAPDNITENRMDWISGNMPKKNNAVMIVAAMYQMTGRQFHDRSS
jgi:hypothetical protein